MEQERQSPDIFLIIYSTNEDKFCISTIINEIWEKNCFSL